MTAEQRRRQLAEQAITQAWPGDLGHQVLAAVSEHDAYGVLAWKLAQAVREGHDPVELLGAIDKDSVLWAIEEANNPAAFLASRINPDDSY